MGGCDGRTGRIVGAVRMAVGLGLGLGVDAVRW